LLRGGILHTDIVSGVDDNSGGTALLQPQRIKWPLPCVGGGLATTTVALVRLQATLLYVLLVLPVFCARHS
jgi:hypothetical protein